MRARQKGSAFKAGALACLLMSLPIMPVSAQAQQTQCKKDDRYCQLCIEDADSALQNCLRTVEQNSHANSNYRRNPQFCKNQHYHRVRGCLGLYPA